MTAVVLIYPKIVFEDNYPCSWLPYSLLTLASSIMDNNIRCIIFDENKDSAETIVDYIEEHKANILCVCVSIMTGGGQIKNALKFLECAKKHGLTTVVGGPHVNVLPIQTVEHNLIDFVIQGMGQYVFNDFLVALRDKKDLSQISGVYYFDEQNNLQGGKPIDTKGVILPPYNFDNIDINKYIQNDNTIAQRTLNYISSQGCVYKCKFCYETLYKRRYFSMPEEYVTRDIKLFVDRFNVNGIKFYDADFFVNVDRAIRLSDFIKALNIKWAASIHPKDVLRCQKGGTNRLLDSVSASGCTRLLMGVESGNDRILKNIVNKSVTTDEILNVAMQISEYGILGSYTFIVGFPGESDKEREDTFRFIEKLWNLKTRPETRVHIFTPYPGTELYDSAVKNGFVKCKTLEEWASFDYYKAMMPWVDKKIEQQVKEFTRQLEKKTVKGAI